MGGRLVRHAGSRCAGHDLACKEQFEALPAYLAAIAASVSRAASALPASDGDRSVNSAYLSFFLSFRWEHILLRSRLDEAEAAKTSKEMLS